MRDVANPSGGRLRASITKGSLGERRFFSRGLLGGRTILEELRGAGLQVEPHKKWFRHDTPDEEWLPVVGEKKWIVLMRDLNIGKRVIELNALLSSKVKAFALISGEQQDKHNAEILIKAMPKIFEMIESHDFPFIAKVHKNSAVEMWRKELMRHKGIQFKKRR